ncbi:tldc domain-containing protein [Stylonychia lemnae]|uniref:Tldc domain-containing protein n=1 Tax=Stylonychia lemnae TaxID=5949 RepID=A0A077ZVQ3_STYLE|nr:tldc domain-containing protein [Stylonychia lemnae]|eukprot:CDW72516.1 tldc domain-containing protein [Stylonychia lemnae]
MDAYIKCGGCSHFYNLSQRRPMILSCGDTVCNQCIQFQISTQGSLKKCPVDDTCQSVEGSQIIPVKQLMNNLDKLNTININCDTHSEKMVKRYCQTTHKLLCSTCQTNCLCLDHKSADHQHFKRKDLEKLIQQKIPKLQNLIERIEVIIHRLQQYLNKDMMFKASEFLGLIDQINQLLDPDQLQEDLGLFNINQKSHESKIENLQNIQILKMQNEQSIKYSYEDILQLIEKDMPQHFRGLVDIHLQSLKNSDIKGFNKLLPLNGQTRLIYKATIDGFQATNFHQKCDSQGPTISFIQSEHGQVFGGYTSIPWTSSLQKNITDNDAFIFSLSKNTLHKQYQNYDHAVLHHNGYLMVFGSSFPDIWIKNDCNINTISLCNIGHTYLPPQGLSFNDQQIN